MASSTPALLPPAIDALARWRRPPSAGHLIDAARRRTGLREFGSISFEEPLRIFLEACRDEAELSLFGGAAIRWDSLRFLTNLLRLREEEKRNPQILEEPIEAPLIIAGLPRSGTTFLHGLLIEDPDNRVPRVWQLIHPYPPRRGGDHRRRQVDRQLRLFRMMAPQFRRLHPIEASSPQECSEITAHVFASLRFDTTYRIPSYRRWLDGAGHLDAYRFHKRFLQHLQHQEGLGRWVLKCPDHIFALAAVHAVYPDAKLVFVHRDPVAVLASVARLTEVLRRPFSRRVDRFAIGSEDSARWLAAAELMISAADEDSFAGPILHVHYTELVADPAGTVEALYRHFDWPLAEDTIDRIRRRVVANPNGGYGRRRAQLEDYGLDPAREHERYARYRARFCIAPEQGRAMIRPVSAGHSMR